ncbi:hypothetical protein MBLNU457_g0287t2 [Dothideomycetes sp. NU457]
MHGSFILAAAAMVGIVAASPAPQAVTTPSPTPIPLGNFGPYGNETYINCSITYNSCIVSQSAAYCATQYSNCLGYNPFTTTSSEPITSARLTLSLSSSSTSPTSYALGAKTGSSSSSSTSPTSYALGAKTGSYSSSPSKSPTSYAMGLKIPSSSSSSSSTSTSYAKGLVIPSTTTQSETVFTTTTHLFDHEHYYNHFMQGRLLPDPYSYRFFWQRHLRCLHSCVQGLRRRPLCQPGYLRRSLFCLLGLLPIHVVVDVATRANWNSC